VVRRYPCSSLSHSVSRKIMLRFPAQQIRRCVGMFDFTTSVCSPYLGRSFFLLPLLRMWPVSSYEAANPYLMNAEPQLRPVRHLHSGCRIQGVGTRSANRATTRGSDFPQQQTLLVISYLVQGPLELGVAVRLSVPKSTVSR
jgi:hypothetical protein